MLTIHALERYADFRERIDIETSSMGVMYEAAAFEHRQVLMTSARHISVALLCLYECEYETSLYVSDLPNVTQESYEYGNGSTIYAVVVHLILRQRLKLIVCRCQATQYKDKEKAVCWNTLSLML